MKKITSFALALMLVFISLDCFGQRTSKGQGMVEFAFSYPLGLKLSYGQYSMIGYWDAQLRGSVYNASLSTGDKIHYMHDTASGEYMFRIVGTRSRGVSLYGGAGGFLGLEWIDPFKETPSGVETGLSTYKFLYGLYPRLELEMFAGRKFAFTLYGELPVNFSSQVASVHYCGGLGFRFNI